MDQPKVWIAALDGVEARLRSGIAVADVGCGVGTRTLELANLYPRSTFTGFDCHEASIVAARKAAAEAGMTGRVAFEVALATSFPGTYDLVCHLDPLSDIGEPVGAATHVAEALADGGTFLLLDPVPEAHWRELLAEVGFRHVRRAAASPVDLVLEVRR
jgi:2-polyprenyl-3-methyl-5-hydroxy-6-metoxy-1,4-benzoquinol methylase